MKNARRGAALPETALILTLILALLVGAMRVAMIGYEQVSADGAAFYHAHQSAVKGTYPDDAASLDPVAATHLAFPHSQHQQIATPQTLAAPDANVPNSGYGFDQADNRHGGVSLIQPMQTISTIQRTGLQSLWLFDGGSVMVSGVGVDPTFRETGVHGNIGGSAFGSAASFTAASDYFSQGENTPPYFGGFHYMRYCPLPDDPNPNNAWNACPGGDEFLALGLAEYLDQDNWGRLQNGIVPAQTAVFWETAYHQSTFATITAALPADISSPAGLAAAQAALNRTSNPTLCTVYSWDSAQQGGFPDPSYVPGQYPLKPGNTCGS